MHSANKLRLLLTLILLPLVILIGCQKKTAPLSAEEQAQRDLVAAGEKTYYTLCIACHHVEPALEGPAGPPVIGASRELLEAKILYGTYPDGYQAMRDTQLMPVLEVLEPEIPGLTAFLNQ